jgi:hypothetical protein
LIVAVKIRTTSVRATTELITREHGKSFFHGTVRVLQALALAQFTGDVYLIVGSDRDYDNNTSALQMTLYSDAANAFTVEQTTA